MKIILGSTSEIKVKALMNALAAPHLRSLEYKAVNVSHATVLHPVMSYDNLVKSANEKATAAYATHPHNSAGLGIEYGLIKVSDVYLYTAVLFLVLPNTEIVATTPGFEIPKQIAHDARNTKQTVQTTVQRVMRSNGCQDPISILTHQRISGIAMLTESIKYLLAPVDWASYQQTHSQAP